jgi:hypothetical protein
VAGLALLAIPLAPLVARLTGHAPPRPIEYVTGWAYAALVLWVGAALALRREEPFFAAAARLFHERRWYGAVVLGQARDVWLLAIVAAALAGALAVGQLGIGREAQRAVWVKLALDGGERKSPAALARVGPGAGETAAFFWQPYAETLVAIRPVADRRVVCHLQLDGQNNCAVELASAHGRPEPVRVVKVETDLGPVAFDRVAGDRVRATPDSLTLRDPAGDLLRWQQPSRAIALTLGPGRGDVEVFWLDQRAVATLGPRPTRVELRLPAEHQGWALIPPRAVGSLALELPASGATYRIRQLEIWSEEPQRWIDGEAMAAWTADGCALRRGPAGLEVTTSTACRIRVGDVRPFNVPHRGRALAGWVALTALVLVALWALQAAAARARTLAGRYELVTTRFGSWLEARTRTWSIGKAAWIVWGIAVAFHLTYALTVPIGLMGDSSDYYGFGQRLLATGRFTASALTSVRTPGYPAFLAAVFGVFGESGLWIVVCQHLALSLLAPLAVWSLSRRLPRFAAVTTGGVVALSPVLCTSANVIGTEALFAVCATAALLLYFAFSDRPRGLLLVGMLGGAAAMVRPAGQLIPLALGGWLLLRGWCSAARTRQQALALAGACALVTGYLVSSGPWYLFQGLVRRTADITSGYAKTVDWLVVTYQFRVEPDTAANRPDQTFWAVPQTWRGDPFVLFAKYPQVYNLLNADRSIFTAVAREADRANPAWLRQNQLQSFVYDLTLRWAGEPRYRYWEDTHTFLKLSRLPPKPPPAAAAGETLKEHIDRVVYRWQPERSWLRSALLNVSRAMFDGWIVLALPALVSLVPLLLHRDLRDLVPFWLVWMGSVITYALAGLAVDRYIVVNECVLWIISAIAGCTVVSQVHRRRARSDEPRLERTEGRGYGASRTARVMTG